MSSNLPLASLLRPNNLSDFVGQQHLIGVNGPLKRLFEAKKLCSMILWGPPGSGKTTLVNLLQHYWDLKLISLSAITSGIKELKSVLDSPPDDLFADKKIIFIDEIHRFNKTQQDALLPHIEEGRIIFIGATTENPAFSVNSALLSRTKVFTLYPLSTSDLQALIKRALKLLNANQESGELQVSSDAIEYLINMSNGDARKLLTTLELSAELVKYHESKHDGDYSLVIDKSIIAQSNGSDIADFDKNGDHYYDLLSAFHKSVRGSCIDGSLFYFARATLASTDITPICRRLLAIATEDIGNADPRAMQVCLNAWDIYHRVGPSEGERAVAQAVIYCALAPKSNAVYTAFNIAKKIAKQHIHAEVPLHLRNSTSQITSELEHGVGYQYAHNYPHAFASKQRYLPEQVKESHFYKPQERGFEKQLLQKIEFLEELRRQANKG